MMCFPYEAKTNASLPSIFLTITKNYCAMTKTFSLRTQAGKYLHTKV